MKMHVKRTVNKEALRNLLETVKKARVQVGWSGDFARIAFIQEYGANLPGGQPYTIDAKGYMTFISKDSELGRKALKAQTSGTGRVKVKRHNRYNPKQGIVGLGVTKPARIPARHLLDNTSEHNRKGWAEFYAEMGKKVAKGKETALAAINALGVRVKADIQAEISAGQPPKNTALTEMRKGFNHPLQSNKNQLGREIRIETEVE
jgi:hypothetical protein|nr:MAG TPA: virion morphogenesis protein [Caudoviricetes sp.]